jgi:hypothetical protein
MGFFDTSWLVRFCSVRQFEDLYAVKTVQASESSLQAQSPDVNCHQLVNPAPSSVWWFSDCLACSQDLLQTEWSSCPVGQAHSYSWVRCIYLLCHNTWWPAKLRAQQWMRVQTLNNIHAARLQTNSCYLIRGSMSWLTPDWSCELWCQPYLAAFQLGTIGFRCNAMISLLAICPTWVVPLAAVCFLFCHKIMLTSSVVR